MALNTELWLKGIQEVLFPGNEFYKNSVNHTEYVRNKKVHVPQAGTIGDILVNNTTYPLTVGQRTDTELVYSMNQFQLAPLFIDPIEAAEFSYDKMMSILNGMKDKLNDKVAQTALLNWGDALPAGSRIATTGSARAVNNATQTGTRKALTFDDVVKANTVLNQQNIPTTGRKMVVSPGIYSDLVKISEFQYADSLISNILTNGSVGRIFGADVFVRESGLLEDTSGGLTTDSGATFNDFAILYHQEMVCTAEGGIDNAGIQVFLQNSAPEYQSDVVSMLIRHGSSRLREDDKGVVLIVEAA